MATSKKTKAPSKTPAPKAHKPAPSKKPAHPEKPEKPAAKQAKPEPAKPSAKPAAPAAKPAAVPTPKAKESAPAKSAAAEKTMSKAETLKQRILERRAAKPIAFTLDEAREVAKTNVSKAAEKAADAKAANGKSKQAAEIETKIKKAAQPHHVKTASLADILGYNPAKQAAPTALDPDSVDPKFQRYYKMLAELRDHVVNGLNTHTEQTLKRSSKEDSGDLSGYGQHMADAGTDTFDRDFALSLVSNEQEALAEIDAAIKRIQAGTYGVCELTGKPIAKERLLAVPFARYSVESQAEMERTRRRSSSRLGVFGELGEDGGKMEDDGGGGDD